jgi:iron-sulfur cluster assembly accessory protein
MSEPTVIPTVDSADESPVALTESAATKVKELMAKEESQDVVLRVAVQPGGCSGMRYALFFDDRELEGDRAATVHDVPVRVDKMSAPYLSGTQVDWVDGLQGAGFSIENPQAQSTGACGDSFH